MKILNKNNTKNFIMMDGSEKIILRPGEIANVSNGLGEKISKMYSSDIKIIEADAKVIPVKKDIKQPDNKELDKEALIKQAKSLGIKADRRSSVERIKALILDKTGK